MLILKAKEQKEGLAATRARGRKGGRKPKLDDNKKKAIYKLYQQKETTVKNLCTMFNMSTTNKTDKYHVKDFSSNNEGLWYLAIGYNWLNVGRNYAF